jgi:hypothetical protein
MQDRALRRSARSRLNAGRWLILGFLAALATLVGILVARGQGHLVWNVLHELFRIWFQEWR